MDAQSPEIALLAACRELGTAFVAFSPLARGFLTGTLTDVGAFDAKDIRRGMPRFQPENYAANLALLPPYLALAAEIDCSPAQLALACVLAQGEAVFVIRGTSQLAHLEDNVGADELSLTTQQLALLDSWINQRTVTGHRYGAQSRSEVDSDDCGP